MKLAFAIELFPYLIVFFILCIGFDFFNPSFLVGYVVIWFCHGIFIAFLKFSAYVLFSCSKYIND